MQHLPHSYGSWILRVGNMREAQESGRRPFYLYRIILSLSRFRVRSNRLCFDEECQVSVWTLEMSPSEKSPAQLLQVTPSSHACLSSGDIQFILCTKHHCLGDGS